MKLNTYRLSSLEDPTDEQLHALMEQVAVAARESSRKAKRELEDIQRRLKAFSPAEVVWNAEDLTKLPPWGENISKDISDLSNYFVTSNGEDLITVMLDALKTAKKEKVDVEILSL